MGDLTQCLGHIRTFLRRHCRFRLVIADEAGDAIALTGHVGQRRHRAQAVQYARHWWRPILDNIEITRTWFIVGSLLKHLFVFELISYAMKRLSFQVEWLRFLDDLGMAALAIVVSLFFLWELGEELIQSAREL